MIETAVIMGVTALAGSFLALSDPLQVEDATPQDAQEVDVEADGADDFFLSELAIFELPPDAPAEELPEGPVVMADECFDNFNPACDVLTILAPEDFDSDEAELSFAYDPHFHETEITVSAEGQAPFSVFVSGVTPEELGPDSLALA